MRGLLTFVVVLIALFACSHSAVSADRCDGGACTLEIPASAMITGTCKVERARTVEKTVEITRSFHASHRGERTRLIAKIKPVRRSLKLATAVGCRVVCRR